MTTAQPGPSRAPTPQGHPAAPPPRRRSRGVRRFGYLVAAGVNVLIFYLANVSPGWQAVPFLTDGVEQVLGLFNLSLAAGAVANLLFVLYDGAWFRAAWDLVLSVISLALSLEVYQVFPFDFSGLTYDLTGLMRFLVVLGVIGSAIGLLAAAVRFVRAVATAVAGRG